MLGLGLRLGLYPNPDPNPNPNPNQQLSSACSVQCESRLPGWDAAHELLTLDFPPHRALLASVQNFQLVHAATTEGGHSVGRAGAGTGETARERVVLVHGLLREAEGGVDTSNPNPIPNPIPNPYPNPNPYPSPNPNPTRWTACA